MSRVLFRLWFMGTVLWWGYNLYLYRDKLSSFGGRDWGHSLEYGINNFFCDLQIQALCRNVSTTLNRSEINETFGFIVTFVGVPLLVLLVFEILSGLMGRMRRA